MTERPEPVAADERQQATTYYRKWSALIAILRESLLAEGLSEDLADRICVSYATNFMTQDQGAYLRAQATMLQGAMASGIAAGITAAEARDDEDDPS